MDLEKYRVLFLEEATEHLAELSRELLALEKDPGRSEAIDTAFRMAHSIKGMAASLGYDGITEVAHLLEDRMDSYRSTGAIDDGGLAVLFRGLDSLEGMVQHVREHGDGPPATREILDGMRPEGESAEEPVSESSLDALREASSEVGSESAASRSADAQPPDAQTPKSKGHAASVRVRTEVLDRFLSAVGEVVLTSRQVQAGGAPEASEVASGLDRMDRAVGELQRRALSLRTAPLLRVLDPLPRVARDVALAAGKRVEVSFRGAELELDRAILDRLGDPLVHLVRNAVDHGIEAPEDRLRIGKPKVGEITIDARREKDSIRLTVADDGGGVDLEAVRRRAVEAGLLHAGLAEDLPPEEIAALVFRPGLSTREKVSEVSGRGVGMDAVKATVESLGGWVELESQLGRGTRTTLGVPVTAAVQRVLLVGVGREVVAIPIGKVERVLEVPVESIETAGSESFTLIEEEPVLVIDLAEHIAVETDYPDEGSALLVLADVRGERVALRVGHLSGQEEIYVKPLPRILDFAKALAGLTVLADGAPVFTLDLNHLL